MQASAYLALVSVQVQAAERAGNSKEIRRLLTHCIVELKEIIRTGWQDR